MSNPSIDRKSKLSPAKQALLEARLSGQLDRTRGQKIPTLHRPGRIPLSYAQQRLWFLDRLEGGRSTEYNMPEALRLSGDLDVSALERALNAIVARHESLRTHFAEVDGEPLQVIATKLRIELPVEDISNLGQGEQQQRIEASAREESAAPFDLSRGPVLRIRLLKLGAENHVLLRTFHHIASDGWSEGIFSRELSVLYAAFREGRENPLPPLPIQYADFALWQRRCLADGGLDQGLVYWKQQLAGIPARLELPADHPRPAVQSFAARVHRLTLSEELTAALKRVSQQHQATLYMTLLATFAVLLSRYSGQDDIVVGSPIANRQEEQLESLIGFFVNTLMLRVQIDDRMSFEDLLAQVRRTTLDAYQHQDVPFERLVEELAPERSLNSTPLVQVLFALQNAPSQLHAIGDLITERLEATEFTIGFDIEVHCWTRDSQLEIYWLFNPDLFENWRLDQMARHYLRILEIVTANGADNLASLQMMSPDESSRILEAWNHAELDSCSKCIHELFEEQAARTPLKIALSDGEQDITYGELNRKANQLARYLRKHGVTLETRVGICLDRKAAMVVGFLAILKSGGAYVPLDPAHPENRLNYLLEDAGIQLLVTSSALAQQVPTATQIVVCLDRDAEEISRLGEENLSLEISPDNLMYVIHTSGSTGEPKGVMGTHGNLSSALQAWERIYLIQERCSSHLQMANFVFDVFIGDVVRALCLGNKLVICPQEVLLDPAALFGLMKAHRIDFAEFVPIVVEQLVQFLEETDNTLEFVRVLVVGSDRWAASEVYRLLPFCGLDTWVVNGYGISECGVDSALHLFRKPSGVNANEPTPLEIRQAAHVVPMQPGMDSIPIGRPIANTRIYILGRRLELLPPGVLGEIYIGGNGIARGYLRRPALTALKFLPDIYTGKGTRFYRTGDVGRYLPNGDIEFIARADGQLKIRGYRVEPGEVEACLLEHEGVRQALVIGREDASGEKLLVAYVIAGGGGSPEPDDLRQHLKQRLPAYMIPSSFVFLPAFPLTPNGKIDRMALPAPEMRPISAYRPPATDEEVILCTLFAEVLGVTRVGLDDEFFALGGHSLMATRLASRIRTVFGVELPIRALFESPTPGELRHRLRTVQRTKIPLRQEARPTQILLSYAQQRLWFLDRLEGCRSTEYNMPKALRLRGGLDVAVLEQAVNTIVARHESLRTHFAEVDGEPLQVISAELRIELPVEDLSALDAEEQQQRIEAAVREEAAAPFDLSHGPVLRMRLLKLGQQDHVLLRTVHHIASDGWSEAIFSRELSALYAAFREGRNNPLPPLPIQYADFALWQRRCLGDGALNQGLAYWKQQLAGIPARIELPADHPRPTVQSFAARLHQITLPEGLTAALKRVSQQQQATLYMTLLAAFAILLSRYSGQDDIVVGSPIANRQEEQLESLIGFFVNTLVLRVRLNDGMSFEDLLAQIRRTTLDAYQHQDVPFERLVEELAPERSLNTTPLFQVLFALQNAPTEIGEIAGLGDELIENSDIHVHFDMEVEALEKDTTIDIAWVYSQALFDEWKIEQIARHYVRILNLLTDDPGQKIATIEILDSAERDQILKEWNQTKAEIAEVTLSELLEIQTERTPNSVAVISGNSAFTYGQLNAKANGLAHYLAKLGVGPENTVGIAMERSPDLLIALLAVLKAGAAYMPLDPGYPPERLRFMIEDAAPACILTTGAIAPRLTAGTQFVRLDDSMVIQSLGDQSQSNLSHNDRTTKLNVQHPAYVIYTSGSTGKPKGVVITHHSAAALVRWAQDVFSREELARVLASTSVCFDLSIFEMFTPWSVGGSVILVKNAMALQEVHDPLDITLINTVPSAMTELLSSGSVPASVRVINLAGEALHPSLVQQIYEKTNANRVFNLYGPTETTTYSTYASLQPANFGRTVPIGKPIANTRVYVLDARQRPVPTGVPGELYIGGAGLARGYLKRPGMTAEKFLADPFRTPEMGRMYRTGDLVRWTRNGNLEYMGRFDHQVKLRGYRIELEEIESVLLRHEAVTQALAVVREDQAGERALVAYVTGDGEFTEASLQKLRHELQQQLPNCMVPFAIMGLKRFPLTPNGKINRNALPTPTLSREHQGYRPPQTSEQKFLCEMFGDVLGVDKIGIDDNFFSLGGHSLKATRLVSRLRGRLNLQIEVRHIFEAPTVATLLDVLPFDSRDSMFDPEYADPSAVERSEIHADAE